MDVCGDWRMLVHYDDVYKRENIGNYLVFVSGGCCKRVSQTGWLTTTEIHFLSFGGRKYQIRLWAGLCSSEGSRGESLPGPSSSFRWPLAFLGS